MEDASKALLISAGILFAILTLSLIVILYNNVQTMATADDEAIAMKQLEAFNAQYEVFNKQNLYGTEVITAVNKAIENNLKAQDDPTDPWYINIVLSGNMTFSTTVWKTSKKEAKPQKLKMEDSEAITLMNSHSTWGNFFNLTIKSEISLFDNPRNLRMNSGMVKFFSGDTNDSKQEDDDYIYEINSALKTFKSQIFKGEVSYNDNGRVNGITFTIK